ncbi:MAG TPA: ankyrin repeat domain-containing protein, partial [Gemmataceae bacterium]|nr:ankyrin repeat domain-containing protein [Gemmataceae bacterium]
ETALHIAAFEGSDECVQLLLDAGAAVDPRTENGKTPLMNAAQARPSTVKLLLAAGADPRARDEDGTAPLHWAAMGEHDDPEVVRLLLASGADPGAKTLDGDTPLDVARAMDRSALAEALAGA